MVITKGLNPASVHVRVGLANDAFDEAAWSGDLERAGNVLGSLRTYAAVFMKRGELESYDSRPGYGTGDTRTPSEVLRDMENRRIDLMVLLRDRANVYARAEIPTGDSDILDEEVVA